MGTKRQREKAITKSIHAALFRDPDTFRLTVLGRLLAFFTFLHIKLIRFGQQSFWKLRNDVWKIDEEAYRGCFRLQDSTIPLKPVGDLGYSGSTFFTTVDGKYLIKSLPRHFEYSFFRSDLFEPYCQYMAANPDSFLVRITDYVYAPYTTLGALLRITPAHHIIMENVLCGRDQDPSSAKWETYDLKPIDYFYPERDLLPDPLVSEATLDKLADVFEDKIRITRQEYAEFKKMLDQDTKFLQDANAVDYSLFLVRFPAGGCGCGSEQRQREDAALGRQSPWRAGVQSVDGKWIYRAVLLDFFWAKHKLHAQALTGVVQTFNMIGRMGPMTITTTADEYRQKFLAMVEGMVEVHGQ